MSKPFSLPEAMHHYLEERNTPPDAAQSALREETSHLANAGMRFNHESALMLQLIVQVQRPMFVVEVGTFTGYSSLTITRALPAGGRMLCCDVSEEWTAIARRHWQAAGVDDRIELRIGPAIETLRALPSEPAVDFAVIDADKPGYVDYYEELVPRLSPHGLIAVDNTMWSGSVIDASDTSEGTAALRQFNDHVAADSRTTNVTIPIGDGVTLIGLSGQ
ncbi:MAG: O-methyltransferase [Acidimicrobiia bacterium]|nr:O-methyltransferase [Acidimicrobiia bacterium]